MRRFSTSLLAMLAFSFIAPGLLAQPRVRFREAEDPPAIGSESEPSSDATSRRPIIDPYGRAGGSVAPATPEFGTEGAEDPPATSGNWFGFSPNAGDEQEPLWSRSIFGDRSDPLHWNEFWSGVDRASVGYTWIHGGAGVDSVDVNDFDVALPVEMGEFFSTDRPWYLIPSFALHLWDGPGGAVDLPSRAYSASLHGYYRGDPQQRFSVELGVGVGIYTDFQTLTGHSLRVTGEGVFHLRLTPDMVLSGGIWYLGRNNVRMLPAGGLLWTPNPQTRWNLFFPEPKLSQYLTTLDEQDVWWYLGGEYGGGSWTIKRAAGFSDRVDINDVRLAIGLEWGSPKQMENGQRVGFIEGGLSFDREVRYVVLPNDSFGPGSTVFFRAGIGY